MESWMGRMDTFEMERIGHVTMPLYPPPCQDHEFSISRRLKDLEGGGLFCDKHIQVRCGFGDGYLGQGWLPCACFMGFPYL